MDENTPLVTNDRIKQYAGKYSGTHLYEVNRSCRWIRDLYEPELAKLRELIPYAQHKEDCAWNRHDLIDDGKVGYYQRKACSCDLQKKLDAIK